jgi:hypothetical protein
VLPGDLPKVDNGLPYTITSQKWISYGRQNLA